MFCDVNAEHVMAGENDSIVAETNVQCPPLFPTSEWKVPNVIYCHPTLHHALQYLVCPDISDDLMRWFMRTM